MVKPRCQMTVRGPLSNQASLSHRLFSLTQGLGPGPQITPCHSTGNSYSNLNFSALGAEGWGQQVMRPWVAELAGGR